MSKALERGDTIIEVALAFAIFALAAVSTIALINGGLSTTQRNLETTLVRQQIDSQAEILRHLRDTGHEVWDNIITPANLVGSPSILSNSCKTLETSDKAFYVQPGIDSTAMGNISYTRKPIPGDYVQPETYAKIDYADGANRSEGIWIQASRAQSNGAVQAYDLYIHACWQSVGQEAPITLGTIVRIYE